MNEWNAVKIWCSNLNIRMEWQKVKLVGWQDFQTVHADAEQELNENY